MESTTKTGAAGISQAGMSRKQSVSEKGILKTGISGKAISKPVLLIILTAVLSHGSLLTNSYITGVSLIAYMLSKSTITIYLVIPATAGLLPYISRGVNPWGYIAAIIACALVFAAARNIRLQLWQRGIIAASVNIISISLYSMFTSQIYRISPESLLLDGALIFALIYVFDAFDSALQSSGFSMQKSAFHIKSRVSEKSSSSTMQSSVFGKDPASGMRGGIFAQSPAFAENGRGSAKGLSSAMQNAGFVQSSVSEKRNSAFAKDQASEMRDRAFTQSRASVAHGADSRCSRELTLASFTIIMLMFINGLEFTFAIWMCIIFLTLWALVCLNTGDALFTAATGGITAAVMGQAQWGVMVSIMIGTFSATYAKKYGTPAAIAVFAVVSWLCGAVESGVVLGIDKYCIMLPSAAFFAFNWKLGAGMRRLIYRFAGKQESDEENLNKYTDIILKDRLSQMNDLEELYSTYLDSRSVLANQFEITGQIIDDIRWQLSRQGRKFAAKAAGGNSSFDVEIAISQCAAAGTINGDCCGWQDIGGGRVAMVISDGMGKGKKAASESLMVTRTMMSLLKSGVTTDVALKMINTIMLMKDDEDSYATLDMVTVDRHSGKARFYKIGAAPTLIRRKSNVEEVKLSEVPLGIVNGLKIRYVETTLKKGDWIIMMSDGVSDGGAGRNGAMTGGGDIAGMTGSCCGVGRSGAFIQHVKETAAGVRSADPQIMSDLIINRAADSYIGMERDDLTVMVAHVI